MNKNSNFLHLDHHWFIHSSIFFQGAFVSLMIGLVVGLIRFIWESVYGQVPCGEETSAPEIITKVHYLHFGIMLFGIVFIVCVVVSLFETKRYGKVPQKYVSFSESFPKWEWRWVCGILSFFGSCGDWLSGLDITKKRGKTLTSGILFGPVKVRIMSYKSLILPSCKINSISLPHFLHLSLVSRSRRPSEWR